jgi:hypothetical protein
MMRDEVHYQFQTILDPLTVDKRPGSFAAAPQRHVRKRILPFKGHPEIFDNPRLPPKLMRSELAPII